MTAPTAQITDEITVHQCTVTVTRRGGWSWGPDPRGLVQQVLDALPELLADQFASHLADDGPDVEIVEPVTVSVRLGQGGWSSSGAVPVEVVVSPAPVVVSGSDASAAESFESFSESAPASWSPQSLAGLFDELAERGELDSLLALLPEESVRVYLRTLLASSSAAESTVVIRLTAELSRRVDSGGLSSDSPATVTESVTVGSTMDLSPAVGEVQVWSVLPFLLAGPLARIGYLDAIEPALAGAEMAEDAPLFAAALAYKVLGVTDRGWRRAVRDTEAAAAFAGLDSAVAEEQLVGFARRVRPALPVLDGVLALSLCRGHDVGEPLVLTGLDDGGLLLADTQGMFPIAWADDVPGLLPHWQACGHPPVLVCDSPLPPGCLRELASAGVRFVTDVRPLRGDPLSRMPWRAPMWTVDGVEPDLQLAAVLPGHAARLGSLVNALVVERRAVPLSPERGLERSVTLAASLGLGTLAWMLWRDRETPDPVLALSRFGDLEASVRFERNVVRVRVPLGRRHSDLLRCGLLTDVPNVVWLGGRTLTFSGG